MTETAKNLRPDVGLPSARSSLDHIAPEPTALPTNPRPVHQLEFTMQKITPFLWFDGQAEEAMKFYASIFKNSKAANGPNATFELDGVEFIAFDGGPHFKFNEAISLYVDCKSQEEVDYFWDKLGAGGAHSQCGWLKDKFGVSWQVVPDALPRLLKDPDRAKANRAMQAMMKMKKIVIADIEAAAKG